MPALRNAPKPPARNIRLGSRILKGAPPAAPGPAGNPPGGLVVHRRLVGGLWGGAGQAGVNGTGLPPPGGTPPAHLVVARRAPARAFWRGFVSSTTNAPPPVPGTAPDHLVVARRASSRVFWRGTVSATQNNTAVTQVTQSLAWRPRPRPVRVTWRGTTVRTANAVPAQPVNGTVPAHLVIARRVASRVVWRGLAVPPQLARAVTGGLLRRRAPARGTWRGFVSATTNLLPGSQPGSGLVKRRTAARAAWAGTVTRTVNATPAQPVNGTAPEHLVVARRAPARAVWKGTVSRTVNGAPPVSGTAPDHLVVARRLAARGYWRGNAVPGITRPPVTGGLVRRRRPARARARWAPVRTTNAPPPPFTIGTLTASDTPLGVLTGTTAPGGSGGVLTASDTRTGGPS